MSSKKDNTLSTDNLWQSKEIIKSDGKYIYKYIPARFVFVFLGFLAFNLVYAYKVVVSVTIVAMINHTSTEEFIITECKNITNKHEKSGDYNWDDDEKGLILGGFFYGYVITQIPAGILAERYGSKWILGLSLFVTAICSLLGPIAAHTHFVVFFIARFIQGLGEGVAFPCMVAMFARWIPKMERSLMSTIVFTGAQIGTVITLPLGGYLSSQNFLGGWPAIFYILGAAGCIWFALWALLIHETPEAHPHISQKEFDYIKTGQGEEQASQKVKIPWKKIFTSVPVYALIITHFGQNWGFSIILTELPSYFKDVLGMDVKNAGFMSSLPYLLQAIFGWLAGFFGDKLRKSGKVEVNVIRKVCNSISFFAPAICMVGVVLAGCDSTLSIAFFAIAMGLNGFSYSGFCCTHVDMAPDFAGTLFGITNTIGNLPGFLVPLVVSSLTKEHNTTARWSVVFYIATGMYTATAFIYIFFASANLQSWGVTKRQNYTNVSTLTNNDNDIRPRLEYYNNVDTK